MGVAFDRQRHEIVQRLFRFDNGQRFGEQQAADRLSHFDIDQVWCVQTLGKVVQASRDPLAARAAQDKFNARRCVENDQRLSRSSRMIAVGETAPL